MHTASTSPPSYEHLLAENAELRRQLDWLKRQVFGQKSERRRVDGDGAITDLFARDEAPVPEAPQKQRIGGYERDRSRANKDRGDAVTEEGLRFDTDVPVETFDVGAPELEGGDADDLPRLPRVLRRLRRAPQLFASRVSNDNPFSESCFKTIKYSPGYSGRFADIDEARARVTGTSPAIRKTG